MKDGEEMKNVIEPVRLGDMMAERRDADARSCARSSRTSAR